MDRKAMLGHKVRRFRRDQRLTQAQMAEQLGVSPSYLNLIENNQRAVSVSFLLKLGKVFDIDLAAFAEDDEARLVANLREVLADPLFAGTEIKGMDLQEVAASAPSLGHVFVRLYQAWRQAREDLDGLAQRVVADERQPPPGGAAIFVHEEVEAAIQARTNHFPELEVAAETLWSANDLEAGDLAGGLRRLLEHSHGIRVRVMPVEVMGLTLRRYDRHSRRLLLSEALAPASRAFHMASHLAPLTAGRAIDALVEGAALSSETARSLMAVGLASYFAAAVMMPYGRFLEAARSLRYDIDLLCARFDAGFEQVCHRLTTLQRPGARGVPFFLIRVDAAGNVSKRFSADPEFHFARFGGACPRWSLHDTFGQPGANLTQLVEMPDGRRYLTLARALIRRFTGWRGPSRRFALAVGCDVQHAGQVVYGDGLDLTGKDRADPIGVNCRVCPRMDCAQRAFPPLNHRLVVNDAVRGLSAYTVAGTDQV